MRGMRNRTYPAGYWISIVCLGWSLICCSHHDDQACQAYGSMRNGGQHLQLQALFVVDPDDHESFVVQ